MSISKRVAERAMEKLAANEDLAYRVWAARLMFLNESLAHLRALLKVSSYQNGPLPEGAGNTPRWSNVFAVRKPREFYDTEVTVGLLITEQDSIEVTIAVKAAKDKLTLRSSNSPSDVAKAIAAKVGKLIA